MPATHLIHGDARALPLRDRSVQCVVTSPPYWGLRDYGLPPSVWGGDPDHAHEWGAEARSSQRQRNGAPGGIHEGRDTNKLAENVTLHPSQGTLCPCGSWRGVLGLEPTPELYVAHMVEVFREVRRVLRDDGTCWLNLGDSYAAARSYQVRDNKHVEVGNHMASTVPPGLKPKDLVGIPWRVAFALQADGWWLRSDIIWAKPNPMPESITDRPTKAHEYVFLLTKSARYFYDSESIKEPAIHAGKFVQTNGNEGMDAGYDGHRTRDGLRRGVTVDAGRNRRTVWTIATEPYPEAHFATFPEKLVEPCILAGTSERGACPACGAPWAREVKTDNPSKGTSGDADTRGFPDGRTANPQTSGSLHRQKGGVYSTAQTLGWSPACACPPAEPVPCRVLDPFAGSGTTVAVAERLWRTGIGLELKPDYVALARKRNAQTSLF